MKFKETWLSNVRADILSGMTVSFAMIPEAIAFSIIVGVDPMVGLHASFCIAVVTALAGGRPGLISGSTGAMAVLMVSLVANHGIEYMYAATMLTGVIQFIFGILKFGRFITFVPQSVIFGFLNALAIIIFMAQLPHFVGAGWVMFGMVAGTLFVIYTLPRLTKAVPSPLIAIVLMTTVAFVMKLDLTTVGDMGRITRSLPIFHLPAVVFSFDTLKTLLPYALPLSVVGLLESLLTSTILDEMTETDSDKNQVIRGQGLANLASGAFGGMAGCALIGQSVVNVRAGGTSRLSTLTSGVFLLFLIMILGDVVLQIPMAALVGVMIMISISTFNWESVINIRRMPAGDVVVMIATMAVVLTTRDLAQGVFVGVVLSALFFGWKMARIQTKTKMIDGAKLYEVSGQLYFAATTRFVELFDYRNDPKRVTIDFSRSHVWDHSGVTAILKVIERYEALGVKVELTGFNEDSVRILERGGVALSV